MPHRAQRGRDPAPAASVHFVLFDASFQKSVVFVYLRYLRSSRYSENKNALAIELRCDRRDAFCHHPNVVAKAFVEDLTAPPGVSEKLLAVLPALCEELAHFGAQRLL
jgi:hypothetical protein